jgi:hypothetical protein
MGPRALLDAVEKRKIRRGWVAIYIEVLLIISVRTNEIEL